MYNLLYSCFVFFFDLYALLNIDSCYNGEVRLVGGETDAEGRVEICNNGKWETVCGKYWTETNTAIVCRHLGYSDTIGGT